MEETRLFRFESVYRGLLQKIFGHFFTRGEGTQTSRHQQPPSLSVTQVFVPPHLIGHLSQNLISDWWSSQTPLDDVISEQILLSTVQVRVAHETQNLYKLIHNGATCINLQLD